MLWSLSEAADALGDLPRDLIGILEQRLVVLDQVVDVRDVDEGVAMHPGHQAVDLGDDHLGRLHRRLHDVDADAEADVAVPVGGRDLYQRDVHRDDAAVEEPRDLAQEDGRVVGRAGVDLLPGVVADEEAVVPEVALEALVGVGRDPQGPDVEDLGVVEGAGVRLDVLDQRPHQVLRLTTGGADEDAIAAPDALEGPRLADELLRVSFPERPY